MRRFRFDERLLEHGLRGAVAARVEVGIGREQQRDGQPAVIPVPALEVRHLTEHRERGIRQVLGGEAVRLRP